VHAHPSPRRKYANDTPTQAIARRTKELTNGHLTLALADY